MKRDRIAARTSRAFLCLLAGLLLLAGSARAELLQGEIFLGKGCNLYLERNEGIFIQVMRSLSLVNGEIPVVDLSALMISPYQLYLGVDRGIYYRCEREGTHHRVGTWSSPDSLELERGIVLHATRTVQEVFEGQTVNTLKVEVTGGLGAGVKPPERAGMRFWLDRLLEIYVPGAMTTEEEQDAALITVALAGALPQDGAPSAEQGEALKLLTSWVEGHPYEELDFVQSIVRNKLERLKGLRLHGELDGAQGSTVSTLIDLYQAMQEELSSR